MMKEKKTPEIRFPEFDSPWRECTVGDVFESTCGGVSPPTTKEEYWEGEVPWLQTKNVAHGQFFQAKNERCISEAAMEQYRARIIPANSISISTYAGIGKIVTLSYPYTTSRDFMTLIGPKENPQFLCYELYKHLISDFREAKTSGIRKKNLLGKAIFIPKKEEQDRIVNTMITVEKIICVYKRKLEELKNFRGTLLKKILPETDRSIPEVRLPDFTKEWKQKRLSDIAEIYGGDTPNTKRSENWDGDINWYTPSDISGKRFLQESERRITEVGLKDCFCRILPEDKTILFTCRAVIGRAVILKKSGAINQGCFGLVLHDDMDSYFLYTMMEIIKEKAMQSARISVFPEISKKKFSELSLMVPEKEEQKLIGEVFRKLDDLILLYKERLECLERYRMVLMDKMFV